MTERAYRAQRNSTQYYVMTHVGNESKKVGKYIVGPEGFYVIEKGLNNQCHFLAQSLPHTAHVDIAYKSLKTYATHSGSL